MSEFKVASRYAKSLIDLAKEQNALEAIHGDMLQVIEIIKSNSNLRAVLKNPIIKLDKKSNILKEIFGAKAHAAVISFFDLLVKKGRAGVIYATAKEFVSEYNREKGIVEASVVSAVPLSKEHQNEIISLIKKDYGNEVILTNEVNPDLIGGFILRVGDKQVDTSIASQLNKLEQHLSE